MVMTNKHGVDVLVVDHVDVTLMHREIVLRSREMFKLVPYDPQVEMGIDQPWITRALTPPWSPPLLPPHTDEPNERSL
jgi:hypothetical protein